MVPGGIADFEQQLEQEDQAPVHRGERPIYPCRAGTPKRSRHKKGAKHVPQNGKHRRRVRKISW